MLAVWGPVVQVTFPNAGPAEGRVTGSELRERTAPLARESDAVDQSTLVESVDRDRVKISAWPARHVLLVDDLRTDAHPVDDFGVELRHPSKTLPRRPDP
jgi:hypothetical protein